MLTSSLVCVCLSSFLNAEVFLTALKRCDTNSSHTGVLLLLVLGINSEGPNTHLASDPRERTARWCSAPSRHYRSSICAPGSVRYIADTAARYSGAKSFRTNKVKMWKLEVKRVCLTSICQAEYPCHQVLVGPNKRISWATSPLHKHSLGLEIWFRPWSSGSTFVRTVIYNKSTLIGLFKSALSFVSFKLTPRDIQYLVHGAKILATSTQDHFVTINLLSFFLRHNDYFQIMHKVQVE